MAPLHHHFELSGWAEPKIIVRFWIITLILILVDLLPSDLGSQVSKKTSRSLILGLGQTGLSLFNYLIKFEQEPIIFDTRDDPPCKKELLKKSKNPLIISNLKEIAFDESSIVLCQSWI